MKSIIIHIDNTVVSFKKILIEGWSVSKDGHEVEITTKRNSDLSIIMREDVNRSQSFISDNIKCGFKMSTKKLFSETIYFKYQNDEEKIVVNCFKLKLKYFYLCLKKIVKKLKNDGIRSTISAVKNADANGNNDTEDYMKWRLNKIVKPEELKKQQKTSFKYAPLISIVVPTFNTPNNFLDSMINSVIKQSYPNWELCIADGASKDLETIAMLKKYDESSDKIKVKFLSENGMISNNTNAAITLTTGEYVGFFDHDDLLEPDALFEIVKSLNKEKSDMIYTDEDKTNVSGTVFFEPHFKPDYSKYTLTSYNYITHFTVIRKSILSKVGQFDQGCDGAQDFDMYLRIADMTQKIAHIPKILYHWRVHENSTAASASAKSYVTDAGKRALRKHLERCDIEGKVSDGLFPTSYKIDYKICNEPLVSIIIPNMDHIEDLEKCLKSLKNKTHYNNYEIIIVENNSVKKDTFGYYEKICKDKIITVQKWKGDFNYSAINNFGVSFAKGEYVLLLNNDVEIINDNWLNEMLMLAIQKDVGCVGAKLYYEDDTIQHAGVIVGIGGVAGHSHKYYSRDSFGYVGRLKVIQNLSAVTAACLLIRKSIYQEVDGLNEEFKVAFNDVDFCLRVMKAGYQNIFTPYAELYHYESKSRGLEDSEDKIKRFNAEIKLFEKQWGLWNIDPFYNANLNNKKEDFSLGN